MFHLNSSSTLPLFNDVSASLAGATNNFTNIFNASANVSEPIQLFTGHSIPPGKFNHATIDLPADLSGLTITIDSGKPSEDTVTMTSDSNNSNNSNKLPKEVIIYHSITVPIQITPGNTANITFDLNNLLPEKASDADSLATSFANPAQHTNHVTLTGTNGNLWLSNASTTSNATQSQGVLNDLANYANNNYQYGQLGTTTNGANFGIRNLFNDDANSVNGRIKIYQQSQIQSVAFHIEYAINRMSMDYSRAHSFYNPDTQTFNSLPVVSYTINNGETLKSHKFILQCGSKTLTIPDLANESILVDGTTTVTFDANAQVTNTDPVVISSHFTIVDGDNTIFKLKKQSWFPKNPSVHRLNEIMSTTGRYKYLQQANFNPTSIAPGGIVLNTDAGSGPVYHTDSLNKFITFSYVPVINTDSDRRYVLIDNMKVHNNASTVLQSPNIVAAFYTYSSSRSDVFTSIEVTNTSGTGSIKGFINYLGGSNVGTGGADGRYIKLDANGNPDVIVVPYLWRCEESLRLSIAPINSTDPTEANTEPRVRWNSEQKTDRKFTYLNSDDLISLVIMGKRRQPDQGSTVVYDSEYSDLVYIRDVPNVHADVSTDLIALNAYIKYHFQSGSAGEQPSSDILNGSSGVTEWTSEDIKRWLFGQEQTTATTIAVNMMKQMDANLLTSTGLYAEQKARQLLNLLDKTAVHFEEFETMENPAVDGNNDELILYNVLRDAKARAAKYNTLGNVVTDNANNLGFDDKVANLKITGLDAQNNTIGIIQDGLNYNSNLTSLQTKYTNDRENLLNNTANDHSYRSLVLALRDLTVLQNCVTHDLETHAATYTQNITNVKNTLLTQLYSSLKNKDQAATTFSGNFQDQAYKNNIFGVIAHSTKNIKTIFTELQKLDKDLRVRENELNIEVVKMRNWWQQFAS